MERNQKIIVAAACVGAIVVLIVSSAGRLAMKRAEERREEATRAVAEEMDEAQASRWRIPEPEGLADEIRTHVWEAETGAELAIRGTTIVEREGDKLAITSSSPITEEDDTLLVLATAPDGTTAEGEIRIIREDGGMKLTSELFQLSKTYMSREPVSTVRVEGVPERYLELVGDWQGFAHAAEAYCATWVPDARVAHFSPKVVIDTSTGSVEATLLCDDVAATTFTISWDGATFEVSGDGR